MKSFNDLSANEKLDAVLTLIYDAKIFITIEKINESIGVIDDKERFEIVLILEHLELKDKFIIRGKVSLMEFRITFTGKKFKEDGGYQGEYSRQNAESEKLDKLDTLQRDTATKLNFLTLVIAVGTTVAALYYLKELYVYFHSCHCH